MVAEDGFETNMGMNQPAAPAEENPVAIRPMSPKEAFEALARDAVDVLETLVNDTEFQAGPSQRMKQQANLIREHLGILRGRIDTLKTAVSVAEAKEKALQEESLRPKSAPVPVETRPVDQTGQEAPPAAEKVDRRKGARKPKVVAET